MRAIQGRLFIELKGKYENFEENQQQFDDSKMRGRVLSIASDVKQKAEDDGIELGTMVYFGKYEDTARFERDGKYYAFIKYEEIGGVDDAAGVVSPEA
jgi:hypothetical protein